MEFQCRDIAQRPYPSRGSPVENIPLQAERDSGVRQKLFIFPPESVFTFKPECCSKSQRNGVQLQTGIALTFDRIPHLGYHFDDPELTRVRLLKGGLRYQQMPKLALQLLQCDRIRHFGEASEQGANAFLFFLVWAQGKETTRGEYSNF